MDSTDARAPADRGARPRWAWAFPLVVAFIVAIGVVADFELLGFDGAVFAGNDKVLHFALYGTCALAAVGWFHRHAAVRVIALVAALVLIEELSQGLFAHRSMDAMDAVASTAGVLVGGGLAAWLRTGVSRVARSR